MALDGKPETAWGIFPEVGKSHAAVLELAEPIDDAAGQVLTITLDQKHGGGHLIGRARLSFTGAPDPAAATTPVPAPVAQILAVPAAQRTDAQAAQIVLHVLKLDVEEQLGKLPPEQFVYAAATDFKPEGNFTPAKGCRPVSVLRRGDVNAPVAAAVPGALSCVPGLPSRFDLPNPADEGARRAALARWVTDPRNVLTWRSIVNRVWHYHFGRGLADSPGDLGVMGSPPTHPELIDFLATWFLDRGGSLKQLHRLIVTSATYRQSSRHNAEFAKIDGANAYLWRMNRSRLDAESIRDALLQITGRLDLAEGGPSLKQFVQSPGIHVTPKADYAAFDVDGPAARRRSVYSFVFRTLPDPFMESMDCPDASQLAAARGSSVTALQALSMLNNAFVVRHCEHLATRVSGMSPDANARIAAIYQLTLARDPTPDETAALAAYATRHGLANACRVVVNSNEFMFVN
jgi:hypothetical protein